MSNLFSRFVQTLGLGRPRAAAPAPVHVAVFGKHRAWDDHIPGYGLTEPPLIDFHSRLYQGIVRNIDNAEWDKLKKTGQLQPFGHTLLSIDLGGCIVARCWQSVDGKGRDQYPMIAAALCRNLPRAWVIREAVPALAALQDQCVAAASVAEVERAYKATENALRGISADTTTSGNMKDHAAAFSYLANRPEMGPDLLGLLRVLHHIEREMPPVRAKPNQTKVNARSFSLRVPLCSDSAMASAELWIRFLSNHPEPASPVLACVPDHGQWLDLMIGRLAPAQLFCMRAPPEVLPLTTTVPYTLDPERVNRVRSFLERQKTPGNAPAEMWP
jgi:hypothetical protein